MNKEDGGKNDRCVSGYMFELPCRQDLLCVKLPYKDKKRGREGRTHPFTTG
nr:hypothetical protein Josef01_10c16_34 [uncultured archaeon]